MKKIVIIGAAVLLLGGGGAGAFMMMGGDDKAAKGEIAMPEIVMSKDPVYLRLDGLTAPIMKGTHVRHYIFLNISIEMVDDGARSDASSLKPRLHDAFLREFYSKTIARGDGTIDCQERVFPYYTSLFADGSRRDHLWSYTFGNCIPTGGAGSDTGCSSTWQVVSGNTAT